MDRIIRWSLDNRLLVIVLALGVSVYGAIVVGRMPVDVFPDLTAPTVTIVTEAHGLAPQEVETLVTVPIETAVNGATGVRRVRSSSGVGISIVWVEFDWSSDIFRSRQIVSEKLQLVAAQLPGDIDPPTLAPVSSVMGEIMFIAMTSDRHLPIDVRGAADAIVRKRLLAIPGVAQVVPIGGEVKQFQVIVDPARARTRGVTTADIIAALGEANQNSTGGFMVQGAQESLIRAVGRVASIDDIGAVAIRTSQGIPVRIDQVASVVIGAAPARGTGAANGAPAVVLAISKQPGANTLTLSAEIERQLTLVEATLPPGMRIERGLFQQADFIETAVGNVAVSLRDGAILVAVILMLFLLNVRATLISLAALPVSLLVALLAMHLLDISINTMTLGGLTIAIGALVDDAVIDVENVYRRLREHWQRAEPDGRTALTVIYDASREVRGSIVFATLIVMLVFVPLLVLGGVEGRLLLPLGLAYLIAIFASLVVALTLTPVLCAVLLPRSRSLAHGDSIVVRGLKRAYRPLLRGVLRRPVVILVVAGALLAGALVLAPRLGRAFLPEFDEGALTVGVVTLPGTSLAESDRLGRRVEQLLLAYPEVVSTDRRTGRAELDEHAQDVNASEIDVRLRRTARGQAPFLDGLRRDLAQLPGVVTTIGGPIAHRIDHMLSGTRASIAVKIFGDDLTSMRQTAEAVRKVMAAVPGAVDVSIEQQVDIPQVAIRFRPHDLGRYGLRSGAVAEALETAFAGHEVGQVVEGARSSALVVRYPAAMRNDLDAIRDAPIDVPGGGQVPLRAIADVMPDVGPNTISREQVQRKIVVMANTSGRDLGSVVADIRAAVARDVPMPAGTYVAYGGQFESEQAASRTIFVLGAAVIVGILLVLFLAFRRLGNALVIMVNLPLALIGGVVAVFLGGGTLSIGSLVGFVTLFGIATRNGIMMIAHYEHLLGTEGAGLDEAIERGSLERLAPILMTALCAGLALVPLVLAGGEAGNEIQAPMGVVILGGLLSATILNMLLVPVLYRWSRRRSAVTPGPNPPIPSI